MRLYNVTVNVDVKDVISNMLESLYSVMQIHSDEYKFLPKYIEAIEYRAEILKESKIDFTGEYLRYSYLIAL